MKIGSTVFDENDVPCTVINQTDTKVLVIDCTVFYKGHPKYKEVNKRHIKKKLCT